MYGDTPTGAPLYKLYGASQDEMKKIGLMYSLLSRLRQYCTPNSAEMTFSRVYKPTVQYSSTVVHTYMYCKGEYCNVVIIVK